MKYWAIKSAKLVVAKINLNLNVQDKLLPICSLFKHIKLDDNKSS